MREVVDKNDIMVINIKSATETTIECPLCGGDIHPKNMTKSCTKRVEGHDVCRLCQVSLMRDYFKNVEGGCIYCGDRKTSEEENTINISITVRPNTQNILVTVGNNRQDDCIKWVKDMLVGIVITMLMVGLYIICCGVYHVVKWYWYSTSESDEEFNSSNVNWSFISAIMGFIIICTTILSCNHFRQSCSNA